MSFRRLTRTLLSPLSLAIFLGVAGCGGGGGGSGGQSDGITGEGENLYLPSDASMSWIYQRYSNDETSGNYTYPLYFFEDITLRGLDVSPFGHPENLEYYVTEPDLIALLGYYSVSGGTEIEVIYKNPLLLWKSSFQPDVAMEFRSASTIRVTPDYGTWAATTEGTVTFVGYEDIQVRDVLFEDVIHVSFELETAFTVQSTPLVVTETQEIWFAPGVGIVRQKIGDSHRFLNSHEHVDTDGDGFGDVIDLFPHDPSEYRDTDGDGTGDNADPDDDNDGLVDAEDPYPLAVQTAQDTDGDSVRNGADKDDDNDGIPDAADAFPSDLRYHESLSVWQNVPDQFLPRGGFWREKVNLLTEGQYTPWTADTDVSWLEVERSSGTGGEHIGLNFDTRGLAPGTYQGNVQVVESPSGRSISVPVTLTVGEPAINLFLTDNIIDGQFGWDTAVASGKVTVYAGEVAYPVNLEVSFPVPGAVSAPSSIIASHTDPATLELTVEDPSALENQTYNGLITATAVVDGYELTDRFGFKVVADARVIDVSQPAVAFFQFPSGERLTTELTVIDSYGLDSTAWEASASVDWLSVTPSGTTADSLTLVADTTGLAVDTLHTATVEVTSSDPLVTNSVSVNVGLWVGGSDLADVTTIESSTLSLALDPYRPLFYTEPRAKPGEWISDLQVWNYYTNSLVTTVPDVTDGPICGLLASRDGNLLYILDCHYGVVKVLDASSYEEVATWEIGYTGNRAVVPVRLEARELLVFDGHDIVDGLTGTELGTSGDAGWPGAVALAAASEGGTVCAYRNNPYEYFRCHQLLLGTNSVRLVAGSGTPPPTPRGPLALNKDGSAFLMYGNTTLNWYDTSEYSILESFAGGNVSEIAVADDGSFFVLDTIDDMFYAYEADGTERFSTSISGFRHIAVRTAIEVSPDQAAVLVPLGSKPRMWRNY